MAKAVYSPQGIVSSAYIMLGENPIEDFNAAGAPGLAAKNLYDSCYESALCMANWSFATKVVQMSREAGVPLGDVWDYGFKIPSDFVKMVETNVIGNEFEIQGDILFTNQDAVILEYIYRPDEKFLPAHFVKYLEHFFASEASITIAQDRSKMETFFDTAQHYLRESRQIDATSQPQTQVKWDIFLGRR